MSPDPLSGDLSNPQGLNRFAYVGNDPTNAMDPLGLQERDPHAEPRFQDVVTSVSDNNCIVNGFATSCATAARWLNEGIAVSCPQCQPGDIVGADNRIYRWYPDIYSTNYLWSTGGLYGMRKVQARGWYVSGSATSGGGGNGYCSQPGTLQYNVFCSANAVRTWRASSKVADAGLIATAGIVAGVPVLGELGASGVGDYLLHEATFNAATNSVDAGLLNAWSGLRYGWGYIQYGITPTAAGPPAGMLVLRLASGSRSWPWWVHLPYPF